MREESIPWGRVLRDARVRRGLTIGDLAEISRVSPVTIGRYESEAVRPYRHTLEAVIRALELGPDEAAAVREGARLALVPRVERAYGIVDPAYNSLEQLLTDSLLEYRAELTDLRESQRSLTRDLEGYWFAMSFGMDVSSIPLPRLVPVRVYISRGEPAQSALITEAVEFLVQAFDLVLVDEFQAETGSWFKKWFAKTKDAVTSQEMTERLQKVERAIELSNLQKAQATIDRDQAEAASRLIESLEGTPEAVCQIGSVLVIKRAGAIVTRTLTQRELIKLERNQHLLNSPEELLEILYRRDTANGELRAPEPPEE